MALYRCSSNNSGGGGGGTLTETTLWTNSSPSSAQTNTTISLSNNINNYDYLRIYWKRDTSTNEDISVMVSVDDFKKTKGDGIQLAFGGGQGYVGYISLSRVMAYTDATTITIGPYAGIAGNAATNNSWCIITKVSGVTIS